MKDPEEKPEDSLQVLFKDKLRFLILVEYVIAEHPDWVEDLISHMQRGILAALARQQERANKLEMGIEGLLEGKKKLKLPPKRLERVRDAVKAFGMFGGTIFQKNLLKMLSGDE